MASDVDDLGNSSTFHTDSFSHPLTSTLTDEKSYQPIFGSFLFADSDPLSHAAFIDVSSTSNHEEHRMEDHPSNEDNPRLSSIQTTPPRSESLSDIDEDDFDGIPIRHASMTIGKKLNGENGSPSHPQLNELIQRIEQSLHDEHEMEDETFLNDFIVEQEETTTIGSALFKDIPDIDDPNPPEDEGEEEGIPFDQMDVSDQSDSVRSSSPDSLLSSSHLRDEHEDVDVPDADDEVEQWNDDHLLETATSKIVPVSNGEPPLVNLPNHPFDQVDFIDSSRSHSRCSNASSYLSGGYADQARQFLSDDELMSSSDSDNNDDDDDDDHNVQNIPAETVNLNQNKDDDDDDICLQVDLDDHRAISSSSESNSIRSTPSIPDETPIVDMDHIEVETNAQQTAPIAALDDEDDDDDDESFPSPTPPQPILPKFHSDLKTTLLELKSTQHRNELIHDIIHMRHFLDDNNHDDEFLAIMHNPQIFEEVLFQEPPKVRTTTSLMKRKEKMK